MKKGKLIIFEGVDGVGKSTIIDGLLKKLNESNNESVFLKTREPGGTELAETIRNKIFSYGPELDTKLQFQLFHTARVVHFLDKIKPALDAGINVICDRHYLSTIVYQKSNINRIISMTRELMGDYDEQIYNVILNPIDLSQLNINDKSDKNSYDDQKLLEEKYQWYIDIFNMQDDLNLVGEVYIMDVTRDLNQNIEVILPLIEDILND